MTSPAQDPQLQGIELLRGVAALMVLLAHYQLQFAGRPAWLGFSQTGVDLFFVLSGFVFGPWLFGRRVDLLPHLLRRLFHIYPLYLVALAAYVALHWAQGQPPLYLLDHVFMLHTLSRDVAQHYNAAFWSLPVEVEFYLLLPLLSWFVRHGAGFGPLLVLALGLHLAVAGLAGPLAEMGGWAVATFHLSGLLCEFLVGAIGWYGVRQRPGPAASLLAGAVGGGWLLALAAYTHLAAPASGADPLRTFVAAHLGLLSALGYAGITVAVVARLQRRPLHAGLVRWTGNLSYGVYLFHNGALTLLVLAFALQGLPLVAAALLLTLAAAGLGFVAVERPVRQLGRALAAAVVVQRSRPPALA
ncbi:MAG: acyltransferase [Ramlibacter sp.]